MHIKLINEIPTAYTIAQLRRDNPNISFPSDIPSETLEAFGVYPVKVMPRPEYDANTHCIKKSDFYQIDGKWQVHYFTEPLPESQAAENIRAERNRRLTETDWMALSDNTMTGEMASYRQALRDLTAQDGFPYSVEWPTKPE